LNGAGFSAASTRFGGLGVLAHIKRYNKKQL